MAVSSRTSCGVARIQPRRRPPQAALLMEPSVITPGSWAASGAGDAGPSRRSSAVVSSTTSATPDRAQAAAIRARSPSRMLSPVGLWKSGAVTARRGWAATTVSAHASASQPEGVSGTGTARSRARRSAERVRG